MNPVVTNQPFKGAEAGVEKGLKRGAPWLGADRQLILGRKRKRARGALQQAEELRTASGSR